MSALDLQPATTVPKSFPPYIRIEHDAAPRLRPVDVPAPALDARDELEEARRLKKARKRIEDATRALDSWERYRALNDAIDEGYELIDIANREARVALIIMGALNAAVFVMASSLEIQKTTAQGMAAWLIVACTVYAVVTLYSFIAAIDTLRPRRFRSDPPDRDENLDHCPLGVRHYADIVRRDVRSHSEAWRTVNIGQLNAELAIQLHTLSLNNTAKQAALRRVYLGLRIMPFLVASSLLLLAFLG